MTRYLVTVQRTIAASPERLFDIVADPALHPVIDGSGSVRAGRAGNPPRLSLGAEFGMDMHLGANYQIRNTVIEFDEARRIAWRHFNGHIWRYTFEAHGTGTLVTEQWDARAVWNRLLLIIAGFAKRNADGMRRTLEQLDRLATGRTGEGTEPPADLRQ